MHELSVASAIVATAERHANGNRVTTVRVRVGRLRQVVPDSLQFCFGMVARESVCEGALLELEIIPAVLRCKACEHEWQIDEPPFWCPLCAGGNVTPVRGEELEVESIEIEEKECIGHT
ncbi:MAG: hydrogenase nickel incorporation protein HypA/HybF [Gaiellales bacterium]|nr:hydrogenase nickel incorporation protein HypA/HybF [Gaiellales bacterium]